MYHPRVAGGSDGDQRHFHFDNGLAERRPVPRISSPVTGSLERGEQGFEPFDDRSPLDLDFRKRTMSNHHRLSRASVYLRHGQNVCQVRLHGTTLPLSGFFVGSLASLVVAANQHVMELGLRHSLPLFRPAQRVAKHGALTSGAGVPVEVSGVRRVWQGCPAHP